MKNVIHQNNFSEMLTIKNLKTNINKYVLFENVLKDEAGFEPMTYAHLIF